MECSIRIEKRRIVDIGEKLAAVGDFKSATYSGPFLSSY